MAKFIQKYWCYLAMLFLGACANVVGLSGGPKDTKPPLVLKTIPDANSKFFKGHSVTIDFDEFVQLKDAASQLVISPFMKEPPEIKLRGRSVIVEFKDTLKQNTTYSIAFGKSIADVNEGNILLNYRYTFSTGDVVDTLTLKGVVKNSFSQKAESGIFVMLYDRNFDSVPYKETPFYISKTDESGVFYFTNVRNGKFKLFALKDMNSDFLFDQPNEKIAFSDSLITPQPADTTKVDSLKKNRNYELSLFEEAAPIQKFLKASAVKYGKLLLIFKKPVEDLSITSFTKDLPSSWYLNEFNKTRDTVTLWLKYPDMDSLKLQIADNNVILDTAEISLVKKASQQSRGKGEDVKNIGIRTIINNNGKFDYYGSFTLESTAPVTFYNFDKIILKENRDTVKASFVFTDSINRKMRLDYKWKEKTSYSLFIPPGTFKDIFGTVNDTVKINFTTTSAEDYGNIKLTLRSSTLTCNLIVQLVTEADAVIQEKFSASNDVVNFSYIAPGNYKIKVICDGNNNKKWDTGNYLKKIQPEEVFYYPATETIKANWDTDLEFEIKK